MGRWRLSPKICGKIENQQNPCFSSRLGVQSSRTRRANGSVPVQRPKGRLETQEGPMLQCEAKGRKKTCPSSRAVRREQFLLLKEGLSFVLVGPSTDWMRPIYPEEGNLLYSVYGVRR